MITIKYNRKNYSFSYPPEELDWLNVAGFTYVIDLSDDLKIPDLTAGLFSYVLMMGYRLANPDLTIREYEKFKISRCYKSLWDKISKSASLGEDFIKKASSSKEFTVNFSDWK